jgi:hypothetical protein
MKAIWIALLMIFACAAQGQSHPPTPSKETNPPQKQPAHIEQQTDPNPRGTDKAPFVIKIIGPEDSAANTSKTENQRNDKSAFIWGMTPEYATAIFTLLLVVVGTATAVVLIYQFRQMVRATAATEKAANAADLSAKAAMGVALPNLILSHLDFGAMGAADFDARLQAPKIDVQMVNYGKTFAIRTHQSMEIVCIDVLPEVPVYKNVVRLPFAGMVVDQNEGCQLVQTQRWMFSLEDVREIKSGRKFLWVYGFISYEDFLGKGHVRRFCQRLYITDSGNGYISFAGDENTPKAYTESY